VKSNRVNDKILFHIFAIKIHRNMRQLTLNISDSKFHTFLEFIKTLDYVEVPKVDKKALDELQNSLSQVKMMQEGSIEKQKVEDFLNEL
jgi:hypothetical protein